MYNNFPFPYQNQSNFQSQQFPNKYGVIKVHGREGAEMFAMRPNDEVLLLDDTQPVVWLKQTDGAGYPTLYDYDISPRKSKEQVSEDKYVLFDKRLTKLEEIINVKSDIAEQSNAKNKKPN